MNTAKFCSPNEQNKCFTNKKRNEEDANLVFELNALANEELGNAHETCTVHDRQTHKTRIHC